jgi:intracellular sulfur oxidation DsrE/DsrF family protein
MNKSVLLLGCLLFSALFAASQSDYKVVFDLTSKDSIDQKTVIRWLNEVTKSSPDAKMEVVMYGQGLAMVVKGRSAVQDDIARLVANKNVSFKVCSVAMKNQNIDLSQLLPGVQTVPDGIYEVVSKQGQGWGYIKVKN